MYICLFTVASPVNNTSEFGELLETTAYRPVHILLYIYTGLFISPSGTSEIGCATTKTDTAERTYREPAR